MFKYTRRIMKLLKIDVIRILAKEKNENRIKENCITYSGFSNKFTLHSKYSLPAKVVSRRKIEFCMQSNPIVLLIQNDLPASKCPKI